MSFILVLLLMLPLISLISLIHTTALPAKCIVKMECRGNVLQFHKTCTVLRPIKLILGTDGTLWLLFSFSFFLAIRSCGRMLIKLRSIVLLFTRIIGGDASTPTMGHPVT